ncbi:hypothetical protein [Confluentibacter sediminis]|uniref:hypothetical protein n=1 Tax=Confluentibacter sediminis TaxID=2219045 RepID=UPI000DAC6A9A|nr:hypothetical protein [Confluentibacter sediminis]
MLNEKEKEKFISMKVEIINLNILASCYIRKLNRIIYLWQKTTREFVFEEYTSMRYMENGIILHLTNLDDQSSNYSFRAIYKELNKSSINQKKIKLLNDKLKKFRQKINHIKVNHRIDRIAHLNYDSSPNLDDFFDFDNCLRPLIFQANEIADLLWGVKVNYKFNLGKHEGILDFREIAEKKKVDLDSQKGY